MCRSASFTSEQLLRRLPREPGSPATERVVATPPAKGGELGGSLISTPSRHGN
jgi:hypothetical protein